MEQRALLAAGLVAGCVTAAGAGGYMAVSHVAPSTDPTVSAAAAETQVVDTTAAAGTEADLTPVVTTPPVEPQPEAPRPTTPPSQAPAATRPAPAEPAATPRPTPAPPVRPAPPVARPARTQAPAAAPTVARAEPARREPLPASPPSTPSTDTRSPNVRPADANTPDQPDAPRDAATARDDRWPAHDDAPTADTSGPLPSRSTDIDPVSAPEPVRRLETVTIPADSVIGVQLETTTTSETAKVEDTVRARVTRDVLSRGTVVVPAGSRLVGSVTLVEHGGRIRERARLGVRFHTLALADGTEVRLPTETIYRDGESPSKQSGAKIGGAAAGGAILGAILGGTRGAIIGAATGAGGGTAAAMAGGRKPAELRSGQAVTVRVANDVEAQLER